MNSFNSKLIPCQLSDVIVWKLFPGLAALEWAWGKTWKSQHNHVLEFPSENQEKLCVWCENSGSSWPLSQPGLRAAPPRFRVFPAPSSISRAGLLSPGADLCFYLTFPAARSTWRCTLWLFFFQPRCSIFNVRLSLPSGPLWSLSVQMVTLSLHTHLSPVFLLFVDPLLYHYKHPTLHFSLWTLAQNHQEYVFISSILWSLQLNKREKVRQKQGRR